MDKDAGNGGMNIQDGYLGRARKEKAWLTVVILEDRGSEQMIFKHAIATINVARSFGNPINFDRTGRGREAPAHPASGGPEDAVAAADAAPEDRPKVPTAD